MFLIFFKKYASVELVQIKWLMYLRVDKLFAGFHTPRIRHDHLNSLKSNIFLIHGLINLPAAVINPWIKTLGSDRPLRMGPIDHLNPLPRTLNSEWKCLQIRHCDSEHAFESVVGTWLL